jgi:superfamily I DNA/RNA helicase
MTSAISRELRVFGPPGAGKTTYTSRQIGNAVEKYGTNSVIVASFTKTAAAELAGRDLPINREQIGTLHAHCYRVLGRPKLAETMVTEWNADFPEFALSGQNASMDEAAVDVAYGTDADTYFQWYQVYRAKQMPRELWPVQIRAFAAKWEGWKESTQTIDFTDLIEVSLRDIVRAPGNPQIGFFDEVQDFTPLELALIRKWSEHMDQVVLVGDDDQCLYSFKGSSPDAFLNPPIPDEQKRVLSQSYRVPRAVQEIAQRWIEQVSLREPKEYKPRDVDGRVRVLHNGSFNNPELLLQDAEQYLINGKTVMFLSTCSYMLDPMKAVLRRDGIPFHNPFRRSRGDWNPLTPGRGTSSADRLLAFLRMDESTWGDQARVWAPVDVQKWSEVIKTHGTMKRGARDVLDGLTDTLDAEGVINVLAEWMNEDALMSAMTMDLDWFERNLLAAKATLRAKPLVMLGTIHSVKGGEADVVYLMPDLSVAGMREWSGAAEQKDAVVRQMYVGLTRCKEELVICQPGSPYYVNLAGWVRT